MKRFLVVLAGLIGLCAIPSLASAATISYAESGRALAAACGADIIAHCKNVGPDGDRVRGCLVKNAGSISAACSATYVVVYDAIAARAAAQAKVLGECKYDAERLCSNFRAGKGRILGCLTRSDNVRKVTRKCNAAINEAGWR